MNDGNKSAGRKRKEWGMNRLKLTGIVAFACMIVTCLSSCEDPMRRLTSHDDPPVGKYKLVSIQFGPATPGLNGFENNLPGWEGGGRVLNEDLDFAIHIVRPHNDGTGTSGLYALFNLRSDVEDYHWDGTTLQFTTVHDTNGQRYTAEFQRE